MKTESLLALLAGAAAGLTLGVLFAPESGEETRAKLKKTNLKEATRETLLRQIEKLEAALAKKEQPSGEAEPQEE